MSEEEKKKPVYSGTYKPQMDSVLDEINNRPAFSFDVNTDELYLQYKDEAERNGQKAMKDTIGQASALTGGYGNSYAVTAGQQAYNDHMDALNDVIPDLYQLRLNEYIQQGADLQNKYALYAGLDEQEYTRYQNDLNAYYADINAENEATANHQTAVHDVEKGLSKYDNNEEMLAYLDENAVENGGVLTEAERAELFARYQIKPFNERNWTAGEGGGANWGWGIDENATAKDQYGNEYTMEAIYDELISAGVDAEEAKEYVIDLQERLGLA